MKGQTAPISDVDRFALLVSGLEQRIADLERAAGRMTGAAYVGIDPSLPPDGAMWIRSDTNALNWQTNGATKSIVMHSGSFTPTLIGIAVGTGGNAQNQGHYTFIGEDPGQGLLVVSGVLTFGTSGTTFPGDPIKTGLPTGYTVTIIETGTGLAAGTDFGVGWWTARQAGNGLWMPMWAQNTNAIRFVAGLVNGTYGENAAVTSATVPFTWAAGDSINYEYVVRATKA